MSPPEAVERLRPVEPTLLAEALARLQTLVSPLTGLVRGTTELVALPDELRTRRVAAMAARTEPVLGIEVGGNPAGTHADPELALAATLGETAERYAGSFVPGGLPLATADELGDEAVPPDDFALYHPCQYGAPGFPFEPFTGGSRVRWVRGLELGSGAERWLPAQLVYLPFAPEPGEQAIGHTTSNGLACGPTLEEAVLAGLLELLERDAFLLAWYGRLSLPMLDHAGSRELCEEVERRFPAGVRATAVDLSAFWGVPTVLGVVRAERGAPLGVGADAAASVEIAWHAALAEAFAVRDWSASRRAVARERRFADDFSDIVDFDDHILYYGLPEHAAATAFLDASPEHVPLADVPPLEGGNVLERIEAVVCRLAARGLHAYAVDVTTPDLRDAGLRVAKAVAPQLVALDSAYRGRFLGANRIYRAAFELGLVEEPFAIDTINPLPHPFP
jgi:ribosomal protein S12 methylthiotransferase accessory factor